MEAHNFCIIKQLDGFLTKANRLTLSNKALLTRTIHIKSTDGINIKEL